MRLALALMTLFLLVPVSSPARGLRFYGDLLLGRGVSRFVAERGAAPVRAALTPFLAREAIHIVNLEGATGDPGSCVAGHTPCFSSGPGMLDLLSGFDVVSLENNHALDLGVAGLRRTRRELGKQGITALGGKAFATIVTTDRGDFGIIAVTDVINAPADRHKVMSADAPEVVAEIRRLKERTTAVAVYVHWGVEYFPVETKRMRELARRYVAAGADLVVGSHPHEVGTAACVEGRPVVWSLGNFLFDQKYETTKRGALLECDVNREGRFVCAMRGHETPLGSYLPHEAPHDRFREENRLLAGCAPVVTSVWSGRFTRDKREKRLALKREAPGSPPSFLELYDIRAGKREQKSPPMPIRKAQPVDLNGDGVMEVMLLQEITSSFDRETAQRVYLYGLDGAFHALWRGSALSRPLLDAAFVTPEKGPPLLVALHSGDSFLARDRSTRKRIVMAYRWNGFGFSGIRELKASDDCDGIVRGKNSVRLLRRGIVVDRIPVGELR